MCFTSFPSLNLFFLTKHTQKVKLCSLKLFILIYPAMITAWGAWTYANEYKIHTDSIQLTSYNIDTVAQILFHFILLKMWSKCSQVRIHCVVFIWFYLRRDHMLCYWPNLAFLSRSLLLTFLNLNVQSTTTMIVRCVHKSVRVCVRQLNHLYFLLLTFSFTFYLFYLGNFFLPFLIKVSHIN